MSADLSNCATRLNGTLAYQYPRDMVMDCVCLVRFIVFVFVQVFDFQESEIINQLFSAREMEKGPVYK